MLKLNLEFGTVFRETVIPQKNRENLLRSLIGANKYYLLANNLRHINLIKHLLKLMFLSHIERK